jgi:aminoglycoside 3-N-acetyltransferase
MRQERNAFWPILQQSGVRRDGVLIVHSAVRSLILRGFRVEGILEALLEYMVDGNLFMPTMTWRTVTPAQPIWDEMSTPSHTGVLSELFRTRYSIARSIHPTHSVAGLGPHAISLLSRHQYDTTPVSGNSPYGLARDYDAHILFIGVGLETCTAIHLAEETINQDLYVLPPDTAELYECRDRHGIPHQVWTRRHRRLDRDFPRFAPILADRKKLKTNIVEDCPCIVVSLRDLLREVFAALIENPRATLKQS